MTTEEHNILELWCKVQVFHTPLCLLICPFSGYQPFKKWVCRHSGTQCTKRHSDGVGWLIVMSEKSLQVILGNPLMYPVSVSDCSGPERGIIFIRLVTSLQKAPYYHLT